MDVLGKAAFLARRLAAWLTRGRRDDLLREEVEAHIHERRRQLIEDGMDPRDAAFEARRLFGNAAAFRDEARDQWSLRWIDAVAQDVRFGARLLWRTPLFTAAAVLSLGIGIGSAAAVFSVADAVLFRPLAVRAPAELKSFGGVLSVGAMSKTIGGVNEDALERIQRGAGFGEFAGYRDAAEVRFEAPGAASRPVRVEFVSANYFDLLGVAAAQGRVLSAADDRPAPFAVVVSDRFWRSAAGAGAAMGRSLTLNGQPAIVIGVVRGFRGVVADQPADLFAPLSSAVSIDPTLSNVVIRLVARLRPGVRTAVAEQQLLPLFMGPGPSMFKPENFKLTLSDAGRGVADAREAMERPLWLGLGLVAALLLVACANTGGLLLSRFATRRGEFGVRIAIGAGRWRLARQLAVEAVLVASLAAAAGLGIGVVAAPLLLTVMPQAGAQAAFDLRFDGRLTAFTVAVALLSAFGAAAASVFRLWASDSAALMSGESRTTAAGARRMTRVLIAAQVACSLLLMIGAVSMGRTLVNLRHVPLGFDHERTLIVTVNAAGFVSPEAAAAYHARLNERLAAVPGVAGATMAQMPPLTSSMTTGTVEVAGFTPRDDGDRMTQMFFVGPGYFETIGMPIVAGRAISAAEAVSRDRVAVVNERFASFYFGSPAAAIGHIVNRDVRIIGVVADARYNAARSDIPRAMFIPYAPANRAQMSHILRAAGDPSAAIGAVRAAVAEHDARLRPRITTGSEQLGDTLARERFFAVIATTLSSLALLLACTGLYAAVAYGVSQRKGELAVRLALGASGSDIMALVLRDPLRTTLFGVAAGLPAAYFVMRSAASLLFGVSPFDPLTLAACAALLLTAAVLAPLWPAWRAAGIDPVAALRSS